MSKNKGKVYLIGAGPGDPELLTLKGLRLLKLAQVVVYDRLVNPKILEHISPYAKIIYVGKAASNHTLPQDKINQLLVKLAKSAKTVVRLKGGDPFVFGRGGEEILELAKHKIPFEVIPGITSAVAVPAYAGIPVTHRGFTSSLGIFTGQEDPEKESSSIDWQKISCGLGTLVFLMGFENLEKISRTLVKFGRSAETACCLIQWGTLPQQRSLSGKLKTIVQKAKTENFSAPAILIVGEVVSLKKKLDWFEKKALFGKKILVTVPSQDTGRLTGLLEEQGANCIELPLIEIQALKDYRALDKAIKEIDRFNWLIFTSQNGVRFFKQRLALLKRDMRILKGVNVAAIGPQTAAAVENLGIKIDLKPPDFLQEGLVAAFKKNKIKGQNILIVRAMEARDVLAQGLKKLGARVLVVPAYKTITASKKKTPDKLLRDLDLVTFTSSSCVQGFFKVFSKNSIFSKKNKFKVASIGPITSQTCRKYGLKAAIEAKQFTLDGLTQAIIKYYKGTQEHRRR
jgi:uroporphyrinogen III methyltransferase/synthase